VITKKKIMSYYYFIIYITFKNKEQISATLINENEIGNNENENENSNIVNENEDEEEEDDDEDEDEIEHENDSSTTTPLNNTDMNNQSLEINSVKIFKRTNKENNNILYDSDEEGDNAKLEEIFSSDVFEKIKNCTTS